MGVPIQSVSYLCQNFAWTEPVFWKKSYKLRYLQRHLDKSHKLMNLGVGRKKKHRQNPGRTHASPQARLSKLFLLSTSFHLRNSFTQPCVGIWADEHSEHSLIISHGQSFLDQLFAIYLILPFIQEQSKFTWLWDTCACLFLH